MSVLNYSVTVSTSSVPWHFYYKSYTESTYTRYEVPVGTTKYSLTSDDRSARTGTMCIPVDAVPDNITVDISTGDPGVNNGYAWRQASGNFARETLVAVTDTVEGEACHALRLSNNYIIWFNKQAQTANQVTFDFSQCAFDSTHAIQISDDGDSWTTVTSPHSFDWASEKWVRFTSTEGVFEAVSQLNASGVTCTRISDNTYKVEGIADETATYSFTGSWVARKESVLNFDGCSIPDGLTVKYCSSGDVADAVVATKGSTGYEVNWTGSILYCWFVNDSGQYYGGSITWAGDIETPSVDWVEYGRAAFTNVVNADVYYAYGELTSPEPTTTSVPQPVLQGDVISGYTWNVTFPVDTTNAGFNATLTCPDGYKFDTSKSNAVTVDGISYAFTIDGATLNVVFSQLANVKSWNVTCYMIEDEKPVPVVSYPNFVTAFLPTNDDVAALKSMIWIDSEGEPITAVSNILGYKQIFDTLTSDKNKVMKMGGYSTGRNIAYLESNVFTRSLGEIDVPAKWGNADDYVNTTYQLYVPLVGYVELEPERIVGHKIHLEYRYEIQDGKALSVISSDDTGDFTIVSQGSCNFAIDEPIGSEYGTTYANSYWTIMTAQLGDLKPYLLIRRKPPVGSDYGESNTKVVKVKDCSGFVKFDEIFIDGIKCTKKEYSEILSKLKSGIIA